jgi:hypothetical protein
MVEDVNREKKGMQGAQLGSYRYLVSEDLIQCECLVILVYSPPPIISNTEL